MSLRRWSMVIAGGLLMLLGAAAPATATDRSSIDSADKDGGQAILQLLKGSDGLVAAGWCTWTCSDGTSGAGPAPDAETCRQMCELSCGGPCRMRGDEDLPIQ